MKKKPPHRPEFEPSAADRATVQHLAALDVPHDRIAKCIGMTGISKPTLYKHFRRELDNAPVELLGMAANSLVRGLKAGESWATMAVLKSKAGWRETVATDNTHRVEGEITISLISAKDGRRAE